MPNFDAGHYFLTVLAPVRMDSFLTPSGQSQSRRHAIREALAALPAGERSAISAGQGTDSPFARNKMTHFARMFIIDDIVFNGRPGQDSVAVALQNINPARPGKADQLATPYLVFVADFDAQSGDPAQLRQYLTTLWATMNVEIKEIFQHCWDFASVTTAERFYDYILRCQIETTMPFNDYWSTPPAFPALPWKPYAIGAVAALLVMIFADGFLALLGLLCLAAAIVLAWRKFAEAANAPFPTSPPPGAASDLPTVLKALAMQRAFTEFAIATQGASPAALHQAFSTFITANAPDDLTTATQPPGVIGV